MFLAHKRTNTNHQIICVRKHLGDVFFFFFFFFLASRNFEVWPMFLLLNVISALEGTLKDLFSI